MLALHTLPGRIVHRYITCSSHKLLPVIQKINLAVELSLDDVCLNFKLKICELPPTKCIWASSVKFNTKFNQPQINIVSSCYNYFVKASTRVILL